MHFDPTVNLGTVLAAASVILVLLGLHTRNVERITRIEQMVTTLWKRSGIDEGNGHYE